MIDENMCMGDIDTDVVEMVIYNRWMVNLTHLHTFSSLCPKSSSIEAGFISSKGNLYM